MITEITYNWMYCTDKDYGEEYTAREVGKKGVVSIHEHLPLYASDPYYCRVKFNDGHQERVMNINSVITDSNGF